MRTALFAVAVVIGFCIGFFVIGEVAHAAPNCWIACGIRHPIKWHDNHCESWRCRAHRQHSSHSYYHKHQLYPCEHHWWYHGRPYWHLHYLGGGKGRTHLGRGGGHRRCL